MRSRTASLGLALALVAGTGTAAVADERYEDGAGDNIEGAPDIVAVTFAEPDGGAEISVSVEFADDPPLETDGETYSDVIFIHFDIDPEVAQTVQLDTEDEYDYIVGTHAVQLPMFLEAGGMLYDVATGEVQENVIDVAVDGTIITWTVDRELIGDPEAISWAVLAAVESETEEMSFDVSPNEGEPWGFYESTPDGAEDGDDTVG